MPSRSFLVAALLVILGTAYAAYWHLMADRLQQGIERWAEDQRGRGLEAGWDSLTLDGFPLRLRARFDAPRLVRRADGPPWSWRADSLTLEVRPWRPGHIRFSGEGAQSARLAGRRIAFDRLEGRARIDGHGRVAEIESTLFKVALDAPAGGATADRLRLAMRLPEAAPRGPADPGLFLDAELDDLLIASRRPLPVEGPADLSLRATVMGALPRPPDQARLAAWRDAGGTLELERLTLDWSPISLEASGTLALDQALQPIGALSAALSGHRPLLQRLTALGWVRPQDTEVTGIAFGLLERPGADGRPVLKAPVTAQDGQLYIGPARLAPLPRIAWD